MHDFPSLQCVKLPDEVQVTPSEQLVNAPDEVQFTPLLHPVSTPVFVHVTPLSQVSVGPLSVQFSAKALKETAKQNAENIKITNLMLES